MSISKGTGLMATLAEPVEDVLQNMSKGGGFTVWVMGGDVRLALKLVDRLPAKAQMGQLGLRLDEAADRIERTLLNLDQQVLVGEADRLAWSSSLIGDRSPYAGNLQLNVARYLVIDDIVRGGGQHLFFVEDMQVAQALERTGLLNSLDVSRCGGSIKSSAVVETLRARVSALKTHWDQSVGLKRLRAKRSIPWTELAACDVILIDWAAANSFTAETPVGRVGNMARMPGVLRSAGLKVGFIANPLSWTQSYEAIADNVIAAIDPVVLIDECRSIGSVVRGGWATWRMNRRLKSEFKAAGLRLDPLFELERVQDKIRPQSTLAYSFFDVAMTLARHGVRPQAIVYPFENQGWEHALLAGARRHLPGTRMIAYQHAPFAARYIGFFPSPSDIGGGRLPDQLLVMGEYFEDLFIKHGWPKDRLRLGGSLRFEQAFEQGVTNSKTSSGGAVKMILVATSIDLSESLDLVSKAGAVVNAMSGLHLVVNFHPVVDQSFRDIIRETLVKAVGEAHMDRVEMSAECAVDLVHRADVLLYNNSGAAFDAFFTGVPAVHVAVDGQLSYDKVANKASQRVAGVEALRNLLHEILATACTRVQDRKIGGCVAQVDEEAIVNAVRGT